MTQTQPRHVIRVVERADGSFTPERGLFLAGGDHDAENGRGSFRFTNDSRAAMQFAESYSAYDFWRKQSTVKPKRPDGKPNRPLTAYTVIIEALP